MSTMALLFLSIVSVSPVAHAAVAAAPTQTLLVPLSGVSLPEDPGMGEVAAEIPLAWSALDGLAVGDDYLLRDAAGGPVLRCAVRSFELRPVDDGDPEGLEDAEVWAALECPLAVIAGL